MGKAVKNGRRKEKRVDIEPLKAGMGEIDTATRNAVLISQRNIGKIHTGRQRRALFIFSKLITHNMSIQAVAQKFLDNPSGLLDHFSIAVLARASIDAGLMTMYISDPKLTRTTWDFRRHLLFLHDLNNRSRFLKPLTKQGETFEFYENYEEVKNNLKAKISSLGSMLLYSNERITDYQKGLHLFVDGIRGAVREANWDIDLFDFHQSYLSSYVHSHPVCFIRADEHDIKFEGASPFQIAFCHFVLKTIATYTQSVVERMDPFSDPKAGDPIGHVE